MIHKMKLQPKYFNYIKNGTKRIEVRLFDEKRQRIKLGDVIEFSKEPINEEIFQAKVIELLHYPNFEQMLKDLTMDILADKSITKEEFLKELEQYYSLELQQQYSVIGIRIDLI